MNRYPLWVYVTIAVALALGALYTLPNFFGEAPAVQVSPGRATLKVDNAVLGRVEEALKKAGVQPNGVFSISPASRCGSPTRIPSSRRRTSSTRRSIPTRRTPPIRSRSISCRIPPMALALRPMYLGLDLRGGVHFLLQVDMRAAIAKRAEGLAGDIRSQLRDKNVRHAGIAREGDSIVIRFATPRPATRRARSSASRYGPAAHRC